MKRNVKKTLCGLLLMITGCFSQCACPVYAQGQQAQEFIKSYGELTYSDANGNEVHMSNEDFYSIWNHMENKKCELADALNTVGTHIYRTDHQLAYSRNPAVRTDKVDATELDWQFLCDAILESQNIPTNLVVKHPEKAMHITGTGEKNDYYYSVNANHISRGKGLWVYGVFIAGNGQDNDLAYQQGKGDGRQRKQPSNTKPIFGADSVDISIQHKHYGKDVYKEGQQGCYYHTRTGAANIPCGRQLVYKEASWIPNENEEGGGSWHGNYYTCPYHEGIYDNPGTCPYLFNNLAWNSALICGYGTELDMTYGTMHLSGKDYDMADGYITLTADVGELENNSHLDWNSHDQFCWKDEEGNIIGCDKTIKVNKEGEYTFCINVNNGDIDRTEGRIRVVKDGFAVDN